MDINKIISIVRVLNEEGMTVGSGQIAGTHEAGRYSGRNPGSPARTHQHAHKDRTD